MQQGAISLLFIFFFGSCLNAAPLTLEKNSLISMRSFLKIYECMDKTCDEWNINQYIADKTKQEKNFSPIEAPNIFVARNWWIDYTFNVKELFPMGILLVGIGEYCEIYLNGRLIFKRGYPSMKLNKKQGPIEIIPIHTDYIKMGENRLVLKSNKLMATDFTYLSIGAFNETVSRYAKLTGIQSLTFGFLMLLIILSTAIVRYLPDLYIYLYGVAFEFFTFIFVVGFTSFIYNYINSYFAYLITTYFMAGCLVIINIDVTYKLVNIKDKRILFVRYAIMIITAILIIPVFIEYFILGDIYYWNKNIYVVWNIFASLNQLFVIGLFGYGIKTKSIIDREFGIIFALINASFLVMIFYFLDVYLLGFYLMEMLLLFTVLICAVIIKKIISVYIDYNLTTERVNMEKKYGILTEIQNVIIQKYFQIYSNKLKPKEYHRIIAESTDHDERTVQKHLSNIRLALAVENDQQLYELKHQYSRFLKIRM